MEGRLIVIIAPVMFAAVGCRGPLSANDSSSSSAANSDDEAFDESEESGDTGDTGDTGCDQPWPDSGEPAIGMGPTSELTFIDATEAASLVDTAYYPGAWPPGCDPGGEGTVTPPCKMELQAGGAAVGDFDADGWPDLYLTRLGRRDQLFRNLGDGSFEEVGESLGLVEVFDGNGAVWADLDGDGDLDLYVTSLGVSTRYYFYRNQLSETGIAQFVEEAALRGLAFDDGKPHWGFSIAVGDYDRDGWLDLYTTEWWPGTSVEAEDHHVRLLHNRGDQGPGVFTDETEAAGVSMLMQSPPGVFAFSPAFVDLDEDGWLDLAIVSDNHTSRLFWNRGDGSFEDGTPTAGVSVETNGMGSTFGDFDGDGHLDWYVSAIYSPDSDGGGNRLYRNGGPRCFVDQAGRHGLRRGGWGWGTAMWDPDNDGDLDVVETNGFQVPHGPPGQYFAGDSIRFWRNESELAGQAEFVQMAAGVGLTGTGQGRGLLVFDYDRDGDEDLLVVDNAGQFGVGTKLWRNEGQGLGQAPNAWIDLVLHADPNTGNLEGLGARIELERSPGAPPQVRVMGVATHFLGQGEHRAHFGLGPSNAAIAEIRVTWPSGETQAVTEIAADQTLELWE